MLSPQQRTFGLGQIQAPACRRRDGFAHTIKVAGIGLVQVDPVNERLNHLTSHLNWHDEDATAAALAESALRRGCDSAAKNRDIVAKLMTREQIAEAQRLAREWWVKHRNQ